MSLDLIIGLNDGFECQSVIDSFVKLPNVRVINLYAEQKLTNITPAFIYDNIQLTGKPYCLSNTSLASDRHRIFIVHQPQGLYSAGKIRILDDIYFSLILASIDYGWIPPAIQISFDAESLLLVKERRGYPKLNSNGLKLLVQELQNCSKLEILGTILKNTVYQNSTLEGNSLLLPDFEREIAAIPWFLNVVHGQYTGYRWNLGGGTLGKTDVMVSLLAAIAEKYPGTKVEDVQLSILAQHAGFRSDISSQVISTNRTFTATEVSKTSQLQLACLEQSYRWLAACYALETYYGVHNTGAIVNTGLAWITWTDPIRFWQRVIESEEMNFLIVIVKKLKALIIAFFTFLKIKKKVLSEPDLLQGSNVKASW